MISTKVQPDQVFSWTDQISSSNLPTLINQSRAVTRLTPGRGLYREFKNFLVIVCFLFLTPCICLVWFQTSNRVESMSVVFVVPNLSGGGGTSHFNLLKPLSQNVKYKHSNVFVIQSFFHLIVLQNHLLIILADIQKNKHDKNWVQKLPNVKGGKWEGVIIKPPVPCKHINITSCNYWENFM